MALSLVFCFCDSEIAACHKNELMLTGEHGVRPAIAQYPLALSGWGTRLLVEGIDEKERSGGESLLCMRMPLRSWQPR